MIANDYLLLKQVFAGVILILKRNTVSSEEAAQLTRDFNAMATQESVPLTVELEHKETANPFVS